MLTAIEIENFKGIGERVRVELRPLTLLYGHNSSGKSTILQALLYAQSIFCNNECDPRAIDTGGDAFEFGSFYDIVHGHDLSRSICLRLEASLPRNGLPSWLDGDKFPFSDDEIGIDDTDGSMQETNEDFWNDENYPDHWHALLAPDIGSEVQTIGVEISIRWSQTLGRPVLTGYQVDLNGTEFGRIDGNDDASSFSFKLTNARNSALWHGILKALQRDDTSWGEDTLLNAGQLAFDLGAIDPELTEGIVDGTVSRPHWGDLSQDQQRQLVFRMDDIRPLFIDADIKLLEKAGPVAGTQKRSALPSPGFPLNLDNIDGRTLDTMESWLPFSFWKSRIGALMTTPLVHIQRTLEHGIRYIGALRTNPPRASELSGSPKQIRPQDWADGTAAWAAIENDLQDQRIERSEFFELTDSVNLWLAKLRTGYMIQAHHTFLLEPEHPLTLQLKSGTFSDENIDAAATLESLPAKYELRFVETESDISIHPRAIGVGISRLIPLIVAAVIDTIDPLLSFGRHHITMIEEPEAHLHPKLQVELGDLFVENTRPGSIFLLETHSEHFLLRLLRRVQESSEEREEDEEGSSKVAFNKDHLAIHFLEKHEGQLKVSAIRVDDEGELTDYPEGFFSERSKEIG